MVLALTLNLPVSQASSLVTDQKIAIPSYFIPDGRWTQLEQAAPQVGLTVINPMNGSIDPATGGFSQKYYDQVKSTQSKGIKVLGYVYTANGTKSLDDYNGPGPKVVGAKTDIDNYINWYGIDGIFLDVVPTDCNFANGYYKILFDYIKAKGANVLVVLNHGQQTNECFMAVSDIIVNFEGFYTYNETDPTPATCPNIRDYTNNFSPNPGWVDNYPAARFWHLIYNSPSHTMTVTDINNAVYQSKLRHAGWVYVTSDPWKACTIDPAWNQWDSVTNGDTYLWSKEIEAVKGAPAIAVPAYFPNHLQWDQTARNNWDALETGYGITKLIVINPYDGTVDPWNPANGSFNQEIKDRVDRAKARGVTVLGYTWTNKRQRSWDPYYVGTKLADIGIKQDIDNYFTWYNVDGIFADDTTADCASVTQDNNPNQPWMAPSYQRIYNYVKAKGGKANTVALNPGIQPAECFMTVSDIVVNFEGYYDTYKNSFNSCCTNPNWVTNYAPSRFWHLIHTAPTDTNKIQEVVQLSQQRQAGWVYVTPTLNNDPVTNNPTDPRWKWLNAWDDLTNSDQNYWQTEVKTVAPVISVTTNQDDGPGSLRDALTQANSNPDLSNIVFNIPSQPGQVVTLTPLSPLPAISAPVILNGTTQPGYAGIPLIELNGSTQNTGNCLNLTGGNSIIRGLVINRCPGSALKIEVNGGNIIQGNYLGTNSSGTAALANQWFGLEISNVPNNIIGGNTSGARNVISGNRKSGLYIGNGASNNQVLGNYIGTNASGSVAVPNVESGILVYASPNNTIGGTTTGSRNLISGNNYYAIANIYRFAGIIA